MLHPFSNAGARVLLGFLAAVVLPATAASSPDKATLLAEANRRWAGARCRSLQEIWVKKGIGKDGSSKSQWLFWEESKGNSRLRVSFDDGKAIHRAFASGVVPVSTEFTAIGWREEKQGGSLYLELEEDFTGVGVKVYFWDDWVGKVPAKRVAQFERWARLNLFEVVVAADEVLVEEPVPGRAAAPGSASPSRTPPEKLAGGPSAASAVAELRVLGVTAEPLRVAPGDQIELVVTYSLTGIPPGQAVEVLERRTILRGTEVLTNLQAKVARTSGTHESRQPLRIPADLAAGVYEVRVTVEGWGAAGEGSAIFQVIVADN